jgi:hypothetical protein
MCCRFFSNPKAGGNVVAGTAYIGAGIYSFYVATAIMSASFLVPTLLLFALGAATTALGCLHIALGIMIGNRDGSSPAVSPASSPRPSRS